MKTFITVFLLLGLGSLTACFILLYFNFSFLSTAVERPATVIELSEVRNSEGHVLYYPLFRYTTLQGEDRTHASTSGSSPAAYHLGEETTLLIDPEGTVRETGFVFWLASFITGLFGLIFGGIGGGIWYSQRLQQAKKDYLMRYGKKIKAQVVAIDLNTHIKMNNRNPFVVICQAEVSGKLDSFRSHNLWNGVKVKPGDEVDIYLDQRNVKKFWIAVE